MTTRVFRNGNSQTVRIPAEIAYDRAGLEVEIERIGDEIRIRPVGRRLTGLMEKFRAFSPNFTVPGRGRNREGKRTRL